MTDGLQHFHGNELVKSPVQVAIVALQQRDLILEPGFCHPVAGILVLLLRDRGGRHPAAILLRRVQRKTAPASANLEQVILLAELQLAADTIKLGDLGIIEGRFRPCKNSRGILHACIEPERKKIIANIVVRRDVFATAAACILVEPMEQFLQRTGKT